jgi:hypothetical protein
VPARTAGPCQQKVRGSSPLAGSRNSFDPLLMHIDLLPCAVRNQPADSHPGGRSARQRASASGEVWVMSAWEPVVSRGVSTGFQRATAHTSLRRMIRNGCVRWLSLRSG